MEHYFTAKSTTDQIVKSITANIAGIDVKFSTSNAVFSKNQIDFGSQVLLETLIKQQIPLGASLLDAGCGYGPIAITLLIANPELRAHLIDVNERALELAKSNAKLNQVDGRCQAYISDVLSQVDQNFDTIVTNPPIRAGKAVVHAFYHQAFDHLNVGGQLIVVIQKKQGAPSSQSAIEALFGNCTTINKQAGYHILRAIKGA